MATGRGLGRRYPPRSLGIPFAHNVLHSRINIALLHIRSCEYVQHSDASHICQDEYVYNCPHEICRRQTCPSGSTIPRSGGSNTVATDQSDVKAGNLRLLFHRSDRRSTTQDFAPSCLSAARWIGSRTKTRKVDALQADDAAERPRRIHPTNHDCSFETRQGDAKGFRASQPRMLRPKELGSGSGCALAVPVGYLLDELEAADSAACALGGQALSA